jgi:Immunity protein 52
MSKLTFHYSIRSELPVQLETPASIGSKFLKALDDLSEIDPTIFTNWQVMDFSTTTPVALAAARPRIAAIIQNNVGHDDVGEPNPDWGGYTANAYTGDVTRSRHLSLRIVAGAKRETDLSLETGDYRTLPDPAIVTYPLFKAALLAINANWPPLWACAYAFEMDYWQAPLAPGAQLFPYSRFHIPWLAYLSGPLAVRFALPADIATERTPDGGLLMTGTEERLDPTNPEHLRRARILADALMARTGDRPSRPAAVEIHNFTDDKSD